MFEINKNSFGKFLSEQRKSKGYTQKELAEKLFISDKAISKWERGLSMPDISLLMPLADILEVSVTELLEGQKLDKTSEINITQVETIVKKALILSEDTLEKKKEKRKKHAIIFSLCTIFAIFEIIVEIWCLSKIKSTFLYELLILELLSFLFGIYFWFFIKEHLPAYYDENKINLFSDGIFRINVVGLHFNNSNWPHLTKLLRIWSVITMITIPLISLLLSILNLDLALALVIQNIILILYLAGLFVPFYIIGKKYE